MAYSSMVGPKKTTFSLSMLVNGTRTRSMARGNVRIQMGRSIRAISSKINSTVTEGTPGQRSMDQPIHMRATGRRARWMVEESLFMQMVKN